MQKIMNRGEIHYHYIPVIRAVEFKSTELLNLNSVTFRFT